MLRPPASSSPPSPLNFFRPSATGGSTSSPRRMLPTIRLSWLGFFPGVLGFGVVIRGASSASGGGGSRGRPPSRAIPRYAGPAYSASATSCAYSAPSVAPAAGM